MGWTLSAPSKTFIVGEYAVLLGGEGLLLATEPRFELHLSESNSKKSSDRENFWGMPQGSPAAKWLEHRAPLLNGWQLKFMDPHLGRGGFGASGAQFLLAHAATTFLQSEVPEIQVSSLLQDYLALSDGQGSGADLLAMVAGRVAHVHPLRSAASGYAWPFSELAWSIVRFKEKVPTHLHVKEWHSSVGEASEPHALVDSVESVIQAFQAHDQVTFLAGIHDYAERLQALKLVNDKTREFLHAVRSQSWCLAAKGCGALGADTALVFFSQERRAETADFIQSLGLESEEPTSDLSSGFSMVNQSV